MGNHCLLRCGSVCIRPCWLHRAHQLKRPMGAAPIAASAASARESGNEEIAIGCNVYISEARDASILARLKGVAESGKGTALAYHFVDVPYNRSSYTIVGRTAAAIAASVASLAAAAAESIDLSRHTATHPRLGVVDHISCHPLRPHHGLAAASAAALGVAEAIAAAEPQLPVLLYGAADPQGRRLRDIRRACGYFKGAAGSTWNGVAGIEVGIQPHFGPSIVHPRLGIITIGATPWIVNYNMLLQGVSLKDAQQVARRLGERGGGLQCVEAMALLHDAGGVEVACNLLDSDVSPASVVELKCRELALEYGGTVQTSYRIGQAFEALQKVADEIHV